MTTAKGSFLDPRKLTLEEWADILRSEVGTVITTEEFKLQHGEHFAPWNTEASRDTILHLVDGLGDVNPLFRDEGYAQATRYGALVAPPSFLYTVWYPTGTFMRKMVQGFSGFNSGGSMEWFRPVLKGDRFTFKLTSPAKIEVKESTRTGRMILVHARVDYYNQRGELVAVGTGYSIKAETQHFRETNKQKDTSIHENTPEELERIYAAKANEEIRGAEPRWWEDVSVDDQLTPVVQGPASPMDNAAMFAGLGVYSLKADSMELVSPYARDFPMPPHPDTGGFANHLTFSIDSRIAQWRHNLQGAVTIGMHRMAQAMVLYSNWMGDDGFLSKFSKRMNRFKIIGDTVWLKGKVTRKYVHEGRHCVDIESWGENQRDEIIQNGSATVILPSKEHGPVNFPTPATGD